MRFVKRENNKMEYPDFFFSFNNYEHCQDSFLGWLFECFPHHDEAIDFVAKELFLRFCGLRESGESDLKRVRAFPQESYKDGNITRSWDLLIRGEVNGKLHVIFLEDKTSYLFDKSQIELHEKHYKSHECSHYIGSDGNRHLVFFSTNPAEKLNSSNGDSIFVLLKDILRIFEKAISLCQNGAFESQIMQQFYIYLKHRSQTLSLDDLSDDKFQQMVSRDLCSGSFNECFQIEFHENPSCWKTKFLKGFKSETFIAGKFFNIAFYTMSRKKTKIKWRILFKDDSSTVKAIREAFCFAKNKGIYQDEKTGLSCFTNEAKMSGDPSQLDWFFERIEVKALKAVELCEKRR